MTARTPLTALVLEGTLKPSPEPSSSHVLGEQLLAELAGHGVEGSSVRLVDLDVRPGVETDMGDGDAWPGIRERVLAADVLVVVTPTWLGQHSSVTQRALERLDAELGETDADGRPTLFGKVAIAGIVGNEDGAHHIAAILFQALVDVGLTVPAQGSVYWNGEAMAKVDYRDLDATPEAVATAMRTAVANAVHLARRLRDAPYPAP